MIFFHEYSGGDSVIIIRLPVYVCLIFCLVCLCPPGCIHLEFYDEHHNFRMNDCGEERFETRVWLRGAV